MTNKEDYFKDVSIFQDEVEFLSPSGLLKFEKNGRMIWRVWIDKGDHWLSYATITVKKVKPTCEHLYDRYLDVVERNEE